MWICDFRTIFTIALWGATALEVAALVWLAMQLYRRPTASARDEIDDRASESAPALDLGGAGERLALLDCVEDRTWIPWMLDVNPLAVAIGLPDGRIVACNEELLDFSGCRLPSAIGASYLDLCLVPDDREAARKAIQTAGDRGWTSFRGRFPTCDGSVRYLDWRVRYATIDVTKLATGSEAAIALLAGDRTNDDDGATLGRKHRGVFVYLGLETTDRYQQATLALQADIVQRTLMAPTFEKALLVAIECWCERLPWRYAEAWVLDRETKCATLSLSHAGHTLPDLPIAQFYRETTLDFGRPKNPADGSQNCILAPLDTRQISYLPRLDSIDTSTFGHRDLALASGLNCCAIVPVDTGEAIVAFLLFAPHHSAEVARSLTVIEGSISSITLALQRQQTIATALSQSNASQIFENAVEGLFQVAPRGSYLAINQAHARIFGYRTPEELLEDLPGIHSQFVTESRYAKFDRQLSAHGQLDRFTAEMFRRDGSTIWVEIVARAVADENGELLYIEGSALDITDRQRTEDKLRYSATHDELTGLWNRAWFLEQLQRILKRARRYDSYAFAVFFIDLNNFKLINDTLGHMVGDRLLVALSQRLNGSLQQGQSLARLGGDEFTLSIDRISGEAEANEIAKMLCQQLEQPFQIGTHHLFAQASIGIVIGSRHQYETPEMVLKDADIAMYSAKARSKSGGGDISHYVLFDAEMGHASQRRLRLEDDLRRAIEYEELSLHYQPIVDLQSMQTVGFEVLSRWQHPHYGSISPGEFIPLAEESGAIVKIGEWVLWEACQQLYNWKSSGLFGPGEIAMSVNVSSRQLTSGLIAQIDRALEAFEIQPGELKVEITETVVMSDLSQAKFVLKQIEDRQIPILLDDFGTGYCSLNYLYELPIDTLKIDRSFVRTIDERPDRRQVLDTIFQLASSLSLKVIAEGVENVEQLAYLERQERCYGQGYLFSKPVPAANAQMLLDRTWSQIAV